MSCFRARANVAAASCIAFAIALGCADRPERTREGIAALHDQGRFAESIPLLEGMLDLIPSARVGHVGIYRDPDTLVAVEYYFKVPEELDERKVIVVDPMLATGNSAIAAVQRIKEAGARDIKFVCLLAAPEGIEKFQEAHPDVPIITAAIDERLNDHGYIVPGLGDAGDRIYGTK